MPRCPLFSRGDGLFPSSALGTLGKGHLAGCFRQFEGSVQTPCLTCSTAQESRDSLRPLYLCLINPLLCIQIEFLKRNMASGTWGN